MKRNSPAWLVIALAVVAAARASPQVQADSVTYGFMNITNNNPADAATAGQYSLTVSDTSIVSGMLPGNQIAFLFENAGPEASSIARAYVHGPNGPLASLITVNSGPGVDFSSGGSPPSLPGGNGFGFPTGMPGTTFRATSNPPSQPNGVNPGEWVELVFTLQAGQTFDDVISALNLGISNPFHSDALLVGIHVIGFDSGGSESFVLIPLPASVWIGLSGLGIVAFGAGRRRMDHKQL